VTGKKLAKVGNGSRLPRVSATLPPAEFRSLMEIIEKSGEWIDSADFTRQAVREKAARWRREHWEGLSSTQKARD
jgi:hypothetical protein